jgi:hypothetical protein
VLHSDNIGITTTEQAAAETEKAALADQGPVKP